MKVCTKCGVEKPRSEFHKCAKHGDGLAYTCKYCAKKYNQIYRASNKEKLFKLRQDYEKIKKSDNPILKREQNKIDAINYKKYCFENKNVLTKRCNTCRDLKFLSEFDVASKEKDGFQYFCKKCNRGWARGYRSHNAGKEKERHAVYQKNNREKDNAKSAKHRAGKLRATPSWANLYKIKAVYAECLSLTKKTGVKHHVDHIVPLRSKVICGLHVENNLQILTWKENLTKSNKFTPG